MKEKRVKVQTTKNTKNILVTKSAKQVTKHTKNIIHHRVTENTENDFGRPGALRYIYSCPFSNVPSRHGYAARKSSV